MKKPGESHANERRPQQPSNELTAATSEWLQTLPATVRPESLAIQYARVLNALRTCWGKPEACLDYFDDLLIDRRGDRLGFPADIVIEIAVLKDYYEAAVHGKAQTVWEHISRRNH
jgi:hypothetical protein